MDLKCKFQIDNRVLIYRTFKTLKTFIKPLIKKIYISKVVLFPKEKPRT